MFRRHPIALTLSLLLMLGILAAAILVYTFDLNRYRLQLEEALSRTLNQPVSLGEAHFSLRHGPALDFSEVRIGLADEGDQVLQAAHLLLKPELRPLLTGKLTFSEIVLEQPLIRVILAPPADSADQTTSGLLPALSDRLTATLVRTLALEKGRVQIIDKRDSDRPLTITLNNLTGQVSDLSLGRPCRLDFSGTLGLGVEAATFSLRGDLRLPTAASRWPRTSIDLSIRLKNLALGPLVNHLAPASEATAASGRVGLKIQLNGTPASGLRFASALRSQNLAVQLPSLYREPLAIKQLSLAGTWTVEPNRQRFSNLFLELDGLDLSGELLLQRFKDSLWLDGTLASGPTPLARIAPLLPDHQAGSPTTWIRRRLKGGAVELKRAVFSGPIRDLGHFAEGFPLQEAEMVVDQGALSLGKLGDVEQLAFRAIMKGDRLELTDGRAKLRDNPVKFSGALDRLFAPSPAVHLAADSILDLDTLTGMIPDKLSKKTEARGEIPLSLSVDGTLDELLIDFKADLKALKMQRQELFTKPAGLPGELFMTGKLAGRRLELSHGRLSLPPLDVRTRGSLELNGGQNFSLTLDVDKLDMARAVACFPLLAKLHPRGGVGIHYEIAGAAGKITGRHGSVQLRDLGLHLTGTIADLKAANGQIRLEENRAKIEHLSVRLGNSPLKIDGQMENFSDPRIELAVTAQAIRADALIFHSDQAYLRDVDGHLVIDRQGIRFDPVTVRLDGGTIAQVRGTVKNYHAPITDLDITAEYGNIDEVIALWKRPSSAPPETPRVQERKAGRLSISASARRGRLGNLEFQDAKGEITLHNGYLIIHPIHFRAGPGYCVAHVAVQTDKGSPSLLKVAGHAENFEADAIYRELLNQQGLVTGTLRGDFYLEGLLGKEFIPTSSGGFHLEIKEGILRKFKGLSKVFSLLNVSQILTLELPDMALEGMPFNLLTGNVRLTQGVLSTEDLFIDSNAMNLSLVGDLDLDKNQIDVLVGVKPLRTVDKIVTHIPIAGWLLAGEEKALITAQFQIRGESANPEVTPLPINSVSDKVLGIFRRVLGLPGKVIQDLGEMVEDAPQK